MIYSHVKDTGQDAHDVLRDWLEGQADQVREVRGE